MKTNWFLFWAIFLAVFARFFLSFFVNSESGGDVYEFLFIGKRLLEFENPFNDVKRLPLYPFFLSPSYPLNIDGLVWGRLVNAVLSGLSLVFLFRISARFGLTKLQSFLAATLFTFSQVYLFFSVRPLSYVLYTLLFLTSIHFALERKYLFTAFNLGLISMTRHEGFLVSIIVFIYFLFLEKRKDWLKVFSLPAFTYAVIVGPFFINNLIYHGNIFFLGYLDDGGGLYQPTSVASFMDNLKKVGNSLFTVWGNPAVFTGMVRKLAFALPISIVFIFIGFFVYIKKLNLTKIMIITILLSQLSISLWFQPSARYVQHLVPFLAIFLIIGVSKMSKSFIPVFISLLLIVTSVYTALMKVREFNIDTVKQRDYTSIVKSLKNEPGKVFMKKDPDFTYSHIALYYLGEDRIVFTDNPERDSHPGTYLLDWTKTPYVKKN